MRVFLFLLEMCWLCSATQAPLDLFKPKMGFAKGGQEGLAPPFQRWIIYKKSGKSKQCEVKKKLRSEKGKVKKA